MPSGLIWNAADFASFFAVSHLGLSVGFPLTQTALFVSTLWGLLVFHEIEERRAITRLAGGAIAVFAVALALSLSI